MDSSKSLQVIKNISSSTKVDEIDINANIMETQIFHKMKYDFRGHRRSDKTTLMLKSF